MDITTLSLQNLTLLIAGIINLIMSILVFSRGVKHNKINLYFSLLTFFNFTWALGLFLGRSVIDLDLSLFFERSTSISAMGIFISLLYFFVHFPYRIKKINLIQKIFIWVPAIIFGIIIYTKFFIVSIVSAYSVYEYIVYYNKPMYLLHSMYLFFIIFLAFYFLWQKYKIAEGVFKKSIKLLLITIIIGIIFGIFFDMILIFFENFKYTWAGPIFTVFMNGYVFYLIFNTKEK